MSPTISSILFRKSPTTNFLQIPLFNIPISHLMLIYLKKPDHDPSCIEIRDFIISRLFSIDAVGRAKAQPAADWILHGVPLTASAKKRMEVPHWRSLEGHLNAIAGLYPDKYAKLRMNTHGSWFLRRVSVTAKHLDLKWKYDVEENLKITSEFSLTDRFINVTSSLS